MLSSLAGPCRASLSVLLLSAALAAQGRLWIVSQSGCPKVDFATIQEAVDAAADGDVILVRRPLPPTPYAGFTVDGKSLVVVGERADHMQVVGSIAVRNLALTQQVALLGINATTDSRGISSPALVLGNNVGPVWIEECSLSGGDGVEAVRVDGTVSVVLARCSMRGGSFSTGQVPPGMYVESSQVHLYDCAVNGGTGLDGGAGVFHQSGSLVRQRWFDRRDQRSSCRRDWRGLVPSCLHPGGGRRGRTGVRLAGR